MKYPASAGRFPEIPLAIFGFALNLLWELVQCPVLFEGMESSHLAMCLRATLGDVNILLFAFWATALLSRRRRAWIAAPRRRERWIFVAIGVAVTIAYEWVATRVLGRWTYSEAMPVLFGVGLAPVAQWLVIPPIVAWLVRRAAPAIAASLVLLIPSVASADAEVEKCHLLCTTESGRVASRAGGAPGGGSGFDAAVEIVGISPLGAYAGGEYQARANGAEAMALQVLPSLTWRPRDGLALTVAWPQETNRSRDVVLPSLHEQDGRFSETAPGRLSSHGRLRLAGEGWAARPWVGLGYALSDPIGTDDIREVIDEIPEQGLESLGVGTDDAFATFELAEAGAGPWRFGTGIEGRVHTLPRLRRLYGTTVAWHAITERAIGGGWSADLRLSGFRTVVVVVGQSQSNALIVRSSIARVLHRGTRVSAGVSTEAPGTFANENALRTIGAHVAVASHF